MTNSRSWLAAGLALAATVAMPALPAFAESTDAPTPMLTSVADATSESLTRIQITGQLQELSSTDLPTTIVVRVNPTGTFKDYTVDIPAGAEAKPDMSTWITGDTVKVDGTLNDNTLVVTAAEAKDVSLSSAGKEGLNGWVKAIDASASTLTLTWQGKDTVLKVTSNTHLVVPPKNPATLADFQVNDRVRARLVTGTTINEASIIVALRRGDEIFLKARTRPFEATLNAVDQDKKTLTVTLAKNDELRDNDVNNLVGVSGEIVTVSYDDKTNFVRRFNGTASADELVPGDTLFIVGRVNDDGTITARMIKDESIFKAGVARHVGTIESIDTSTNTIHAKLVATDDNEGKMHAQMEGDGELRPTATGGSLALGSEWTITYTDATTFMKDGKTATETDLKVGDLIRVEGVANATAKTVAATKISAGSPTFHPLTRIRPLSEIVKDRIETSLGKEHAGDIISRQKPADSQDGSPDNSRE